MTGEKALEEKFWTLSEAFDAERIAKQDPAFLFPCLVRTWQSVAKWPDDIEPQSTLAGEFYTFRATYDHLQKIAAMPEVRGLTIR